MFARTMHAETLVRLSAGRNISEGLRRFGLNGDSKAVVVAVLAKKQANGAKEGDGSSHPDLLPAAEVLAGMPAVAKALGGSAVPQDELAARLETHADVTRLTKVYKVAGEELRVGTLEEAILCRMAQMDL